MSKAKAKQPLSLWDLIKQLEPPANPVDAHFNKMLQKALTKKKKSA